MLFASQPKPWIEEDVDVLVETATGNENPVRLIVYNDDVNSFEWVIQCFMEVLHHTSEQSEQLAIIIHNNGKATVKEGARQELQPKKEALSDRGLSAVIEGDDES